MVVYGIPNCNTLKKAQDWLKENQLDFEFHDFKKRGVSVDKLNEWFAVFGWEKVINKNGLTFKKLNKDEQALLNNAENVANYLMQNTSAIKRPIVEVAGKAVCLGFKEEEYKAKFNV